MKWNGNFGNEYGRCQNGMERKISRMEWKTIFHTSILPYQFRTRFRALHLKKNIYGCRVVINNIVAEVFHFNIYAYYLSTNRGTLVVFTAQTVYELHHSKYIAICSIDVMVDNFDRFDLFFLFYFEIDNFPSRIFFLLPSLRKSVFAISFPFQPNFILYFSF